MIADYLIKINADVNRKSVKGNTALHDCAESGSLNIMKLLLDNGAKMDVDSYGKRCVSPESFVYYFGCHYYLKKEDLF